MHTRAAHYRLYWVHVSHIMADMINELNEEFKDFRSNISEGHRQWRGTEDGIQSKFDDKLGTGVPRMRRSLAAAGLAKPIFKFTEFVTVEIFRAGYPKAETNQISGQVKVTDNQWDMLLLEMSGQVSDQVSGQVKKRMFRILKALLGKRLKANQIGEILDEPVATLRRDINMLRDWNVILFKGSPKTGGYTFSEEVLMLLMHNKE